MVDRHIRKADKAQANHAGQIFTWMSGTGRAERNR